MKNLLPSVSFLVHQHCLLQQLPLIVATGPKGRLLKGDVLSYLKDSCLVVDEEYDSITVNGTNNLNKLAVSAFSEFGFEIAYFTKNGIFGTINTGFDMETSREINCLKNDFRGSFRIVDQLESLKQEDCHLINGEAAILSISKQLKIADDDYFAGLFEEKQESKRNLSIKESEDLYDELTKSINIYSVLLDLTFNPKVIDKKKARKYLEKVKKLVEEQ
jgi:hypothetical protein